MLKNCVFKTRVENKLRKCGGLAHEKLLLLVLQFSY